MVTRDLYEQILTCDQILDISENKEQYLFGFKTPFYSLKHKITAI
jgi:hypothetical protein